MRLHYADIAGEEELYLAGARVTPGFYREIGTGRVVQLDRDDTLPATLDGRVASYIRVAKTWEQIASQIAPNVKGE
jgi:hypothetical protein